MRDPQTVTDDGALTLYDHRDAVIAKLERQLAATKALRDAAEGLLTLEDGVAPVPDDGERDFSDVRTAYAAMVGRVDMHHGYLDDAVQALNAAIARLQGVTA